MGGRQMENPILKPLSVPELLDKGFQIYKRHVWMLLAIAAIISIPEMIVQSILAFQLIDERLSNLISNVLSPFAQLALTLAISNLYLGREASIRTSYSRSSYKYFTLFGANILIGLAIVIPAAILGVSFVLALPAGIFVSLFVVPLLVFWSTRWSLTVPAILLEDTGASKGLGRSWSLTEGHFWRVFGTSFAASLLTILLSTLPVIFANYLLTELFHFTYEVVAVVNVIVEKLALLLLAPFSMAVNVLIYYDLRIRKEGFDLFEMIGSTEEDDDDEAS
jgi:hypothetical protein